MTITELSNYMKENLSNYSIFYEKALKFQNEKNRKRTKKWSEYRIKKEVDTMWKNVINNIYNQVSTAARKDNTTIKNFIEKNNLVDMINDSMAEIEFSEE